jgi:hypothetical protein
MERCGEILQSDVLEAFAIPEIVRRKWVSGHGDVESLPAALNRIAEHSPVHSDFVRAERQCASDEVSGSEPGVTTRASYGRTEFGASLFQSFGRGRWKKKTREFGIG